METWIAKHWWEIARLLLYVAGGGVTAYLLLKSLKRDVEDNAKALAGTRQELAEFRKKAEENWQSIHEMFEDHIESEEPHKVCPVHSSQLKDVVDRLDRVWTEIRDLRKDNSEFKVALFEVLRTAPK